MQQGDRENPREGTRQYNARNFGIRAAFGTSPEGGGKEAAAKDASRLFTKNTGPCELERGCIGADAWPVSEGYSARLVAGWLSPDERRR